ncbi:MAG: mitomycin resistance protein [Rubrobacter sp.]|nr:mitomycin resistance protein [Rubrobacter sp.]
MAKTEREFAGSGRGRDGAMARLQEIPNVGPKMAADLLMLGVARLEDAAGRDPDEMYHELRALDAKRHDPCVRDVFAAVISYAEGHPARPWWEFTPERKAREAEVEKS